LVKFIAIINYKQLVLHRENEVHTLIFSSSSFRIVFFHGQASASKNQYILLNEMNAKGVTVKELGSNIMVIYQDAKNTYWFGS
jgi:hypothetical protein